VLPAGSDHAGMAQLSGWLLSQRTDRMRVKTVGERSHLLLRLAT
jgi:hypothetical protein